MRCYRGAPFLLVVIMFCTSLSALAVDSPHSNLPGYGIECGSCHWTHASSAPPWATILNSPDPADDTLNNRRCLVCHDGSRSIPAARTHSTSTTSTRFWTTQGWKTDCITCHDPHVQGGWGTLSFVATGPPPLAVGPWNTSSGNWTTITLGNPVSGNYSGYYFLPDKNYPIYYEVMDDTSGRNSFRVKGGVLTPYVKTGGYAFVYGKNVRDHINYTNPASQKVGGAVKIFGPEGTYGPGDADNKTTSVCFVCHTKGDHWSTVGDTAHNNRSTCSVCHLHLDGFWASCRGCHGNPPTSSTSFSYPDGLVWLTGSRTGSRVAGAHARHVTDCRISCEACHANSVGTGPTHNNNRTVSMGFSWKGATGGSYDGQTGTLYDSSDGGRTTVSAGGIRKCGNVYCHSDGTSLSTGAALTGMSPAWDWGSGRLACNACHGYPLTYEGGTPKTNSHLNHAKLSMSTGWTTLLYTCNFCHSQTTTDGISISNASTHVNRIYDVNAGGWASFTYTYSTTGGTCTSNYCHSNVQPNGGAGAPDYYATVKWGATNIGCGSCHNKSSDHNSYSWATVLMNSGSHTVHRTKLATDDCTVCHDLNPAGINCYDSCHSSETQRRHVNGRVDIIFRPTNGRWGTYSGTPVPGDGYGSCSNTYCHGDSTTPSWGAAGGLACNSCHGAGSALAGAHNRHYESSVVAVNHWAANNSTTTEYRFNCGVCHSPSSGYVRHLSGPWFGVGGGQIADVAVEYTVMQGSTPLPTSGTYNRGAPAAAALNNPDRTFGWTDGTCSNIYCHDNGAYITNPGMFPLERTSPKWDNTSPDPQGDAYVCNNCHMWNIRHDAHQRHVLDKNYTCKECHAAAVDSCDNISRWCSIADKSRHVNGRFDVSGNFWYTFRPYNNGMGGKCSANACHAAQDPPVNQDDWTYNHFWSTMTQTNQVPSGGNCTVTVRIDSSTPYTDSQPYTYSFDWGDGLPKTSFSSWGTWSQANHTYQGNGNYTIIWQVKDARDRRMGPPNPGAFSANACN